LEKLDPLILFSIYQMAQNSKSAALALAMTVKPDSISLEEAVNIARLDE
jgi:chaperone required for assembly of F1-ATPase